MAAPRRNAQAAAQPAWFSPALLVAGVLVGAVVTYFGYPGAALTWLFATVAAWAAPPALFTGKKDASGYPTAAHPGEAAAMQRYRFWSDLKWRLLFPAEALAPGWPVYASWLSALWAAAAVWCLPHVAVGSATDLLRHVDAAFVFVLVTQVAAARRRTVVAGDVSPGVRVDAAKQIRSADKETVAPAAAATVVGGLLGAYLAGCYLPAPPLPGGGLAWFLLGALGGAGAGIAKWWVTASLAPWRLVVEARAEWAPRWQMLKHDPAPVLTARDKVGSATVDTFTAPGSMGAMAYWPLAPKVTPTMGAGQRVAILSTPNTDSQNQPVPGTRHPLQFQVVCWPSDATPDITALDADPDEVNLLLQCAMVWAADEGGYARPILNEAQPLALLGEPAPATGDEADETEPAPVSTRQSWGMTWLLPDGPPMTYLRNALAEPFGGHLGCEVLVDHRSGFVYAGALTDGSTIFDPSTGVSAEALMALATEDVWNARWAAVLKQDVNPPTIEHSTYAEARLSNGKTLYRQAFVTRQGVDPMDFFGLEAKISASINAAPYVAVCGWGSTRRGDRTARPGERHPQAFTVYWAAEAVPANPDTLAPAGGREEAAQWVLAGRVNQAFKAARLAQPEMYDAKCLTHARSRGHIWKMPLRLYGGVTLADVRGAAQRLRQALGSEWLRVEAAPDGCILVAGASPSKVQLVNPRKDERYLASLDWEQAFLDAKVVGVGGITPTLTEVDRLPRNEQVQVLDFTLPSGLSFVDVKAKSKALETSSRNAFVEVRRAPDGKADAFRLLASEVNPMPERAGFDFEAADEGAAIPFATNLFGEPTTYDNSLDAHLLVSGASGGGKSVTLQNLIYGALVRGWDLYVVDPSKGGVDFNFAEPYARAVGRTVWEAKGIIAAIYEEVLRRKAINSQYNCGNYRDLPEDVRYNHVLIVLDEFTSMMMPQPIAKPVDDSPESAHAYEAAKAESAARAYIGTYVGKIVREARSTGFTMLLATQALKAETLSKIPGANDLKDNMSRMIVGRASYGQLAAALKMPTEAPEQPDVLPPGRGLYEGNGRAAEVVQCWFEGSQATFAQHLAARIAPVPAHRRIDLSVFVEPELEVNGARIDGQVLAPSYPQSAEDQVVDLGEFELSLDDLELSLEDLEAEAEPVEEATGLSGYPDSQSVEADAEATFDWDAAQAQALLAEGREEPVDDLDWDSVAEVSPDTDDTTPSEEADDAVVVETAVVWDEIDPTPWQPAESAYGWTEIEAVLGFLTDYPQVREITWTDAHLLDDDEMGIAFRDVVEDLLADRGVTLVGPAPATAALPVLVPVGAPVEDDDEFGPLPTVPAHLIPDDDPFG